MAPRPCDSRNAAGRSHVGAWPGGTGGQRELHFRPLGPHVPWGHTVRPCGAHVELASQLLPGTAGGASRLSNTFTLPSSLWVAESLLLRNKETGTQRSGDVSRATRLVEAGLGQETRFFS